MDNHTRNISSGSSIHGMSSNDYCVVCICAPASKTYGTQERNETSRTGETNNE